MRLRRSDLRAPGIRRRRAGKGFTYVDPTGRRVTDPVLLERLRALVIPPAWTDVWICPWPHGHIQAVGTDAAGRRQYLYHPQWRLMRDAAKHERVLAFAESLPSARRATARRITAEGLTPERVLAGCFRLLDLSALRIGGEAYAETNDTYGLATLRREHTRVHDGRVELTFKGKSGKELSPSVLDRPLAALVTDLLRREDDHPELLGWWDGDRWHDLTSSDVNAYLRELLGMEASAKDFRTWNATVLMGQLLGHAGVAASERSRKKVVAECFREVSAYLGNTPAVARSSYVDPRIVDRYHEGVVIAPEDVPRRAVALPVHPRSERAVLALLAGPRRSARRAA